MTSQTDVLTRLDAADPELSSVAGRRREVRSADPPWWPGIQVVEVIVFLPHKPLLFRYALSPSRVIPLGSSSAFAAVNAAVGLQLEAPQVPSYLRFFIASTEHRAMQVVERPDEPLWFGSADTDPAEASLKTAAQGLIQPISVIALGDGYRCELNAIDYRELLSVVFDVTPDGRVTLVSRNVLMESLPVPYVMG